MQERKKKGWWEGVWPGDSAGASTNMHKAPVFFGYRREQAERLLQRLCWQTLCKRAAEVMSSEENKKKKKKKEEAHSPSRPVIYNSADV